MNLNIEAIYLSHQSELQHHLARIVDCPELASDLVHDSFIIFFREIKKQTIEHPRGFLFRIARNLAYDHIKHRKVTENYQQTEDPTLLPPIESPSAEKMASIEERLDTVMKILDELPTRTRDIFVLNRIYGMTYSETAREFNISDSAVEKHLARTFLHCRTQFKTHGLDQRDN